jgi:hypothetical protein
MLRFVPRNNKAGDIAVPNLKPGWYFNNKTSSVHSVGPEKIIRNAGGLNPRRLVPVDFDGSDIDAPGLWVRKEHSVKLREDVALKSLLEGDVWLAMNLLAFDRTLTPEPDGAITRRLDLAAGIVLWLKWAEGLERVSGSARRLAAGTQSNKLRAALEARVVRWNGPSGAKWRASRWNSSDPFRWSGRTVLREQLPALRFQFADAEYLP